MAFLLLHNYTDFIQKFRLMSIKNIFLFYVLKYFSKRKNCIKVIVEREEI